VLDVAEADIKRRQQVREPEVHHDLHRDEEWEPQQSLGWRGPNTASTTKRTTRLRRKFASDDSTLAAGAAAGEAAPSHDRRVRDDRSRAGLKRVREERPGEQTDEKEHRIRLLPRLGTRPRTEENTEEDPEDDELQQRDEEVPAETEDGPLVARAKLAPSEIAEQLASFDERAEVRDHGASMLRAP